MRKKKQQPAITMDRFTQGAEGSAWSQNPLSVQGLYNVLKTMVRGGVIPATDYIHRSRGALTDGTGLAWTDGSMIYLGTEFLRPNEMKKYGLYTVGEVSLFVQAIARHEAAHILILSTCHHSIDDYIKKHIPVEYEKMFGEGVNTNVAYMCANVTEDMFVDQKLIPQKLNDNKWQEWMLGRLLHGMFPIVDDGTPYKRELNYLHYYRSPEHWAWLQENDPELSDVIDKHLSSVLRTDPPLEAREKPLLKFIKEVMDLFEAEPDSSDGDAPSEGSSGSDTSMGEGDFKSSEKQQSGEQSTTTSGVVDIDGTEISLRKFNVEESHTKRARPERIFSYSSRRQAELLPGNGFAKMLQMASYNMAYYESGYRGGRLRGSGAVRVAMGDNNPFSRKVGARVYVQPATILLQDVSGSTGAAVDAETRRQYGGGNVGQCLTNLCYSLYTDIRRMRNSSVGAFAHTTHGSSAKLYAVDGNFPPEYVPLMNGKEAWDILSDYNGSGNNDGGALLACTEMICEAAGNLGKLIIVLSDGIPSSSDEGSSEEYLRYAIREAERQGVMVIAIALNKELADNLKRYYTYVFNMQDHDVYDQIFQLFGASFYDEI